MYIMGGDVIARDTGIGLMWLKKAAEHGGTKEMNFLGNLYADGMWDVPKDEAQAAIWYRKAADLGDRRAMLSLSTAAMSRQDYQEAFLWTRKLADLGEHSAELTLGSMYIEGQGIPKDRDQGLSWLKKASSHDDFIGGLAKKIIAQLENEGRPLAPAPPDFDKIRAEAEQGSAEAQYRLGEIYGDDKSVLKDDVQAASWYRKAAEQGYVTAEAQLSEMYFEGKGVPKDYGLSNYWLRKAAEHGRAESQLALSRQYFNGIFGVQRDDALGLQWLIKAADAGYAAALLDLARAYDAGRKGMPKDRVKAAYWYEQAAERGDVQAQYFLAERYERGDGVVKDIDKALFWMRKAAAHDTGDFVQNLAADALVRLEKEVSPH
jgi:TPR repeat protein